MDISSVTSSSIFQTGLFANTGVQSVVFALDTPATTGASNIDTVDISGLGKLLSAASLFESGILQSTTDSQTGFSTLATATQFFADAFNSYLQSGFGNSQTASGGSLGDLFVQLLDSRLNTASDNGASIISRLSDIGISFQSSSTQSATAQMTIDFQALRSAFDADQTGTITLLTQATQSIALLAAEFSGTLVQLDNLTQTDTSQILPVTVASNGAPATTADLATTTQPTTALALAEATTTQPTATALPSAAGSPTTTGAGAATTQTTTVSQATATQATAVETTTPATTTEQPATAAQPTEAALPAATGSPATTEAGTASTQTTTVSPATTTQATAAETVAETTTLATTTEQPATAAQPTATAPLSATGSPTTTVTGAAPTQTTAGLPATTTPLALTTPAVAAALPATPVSSTVTATPTTLATASAVTVAPNAIPLNLVNPIIDASNPAVMAAILAYHLVDGIFDTGQMHLEAPPPPLRSDSEIRPVAQIPPVKLDLYV